MEASVTLAIVAISVVLGVVACLALILHILWRVYVCGGPADMKAFAKAVREVYDPGCGSPAVT